MLLLYPPVHTFSLYTIRVRALTLLHLLLNIAPYVYSTTATKADCICDKRHKDVGIDKRHKDVGIDTRHIDVGTAKRHIDVGIVKRHIDVGSPNVT